MPDDHGRHRRRRRARSARHRAVHAGGLLARGRPQSSPPRRGRREDARRAARPRDAARGPGRRSLRAPALRRRVSHPGERSAARRARHRAAPGGRSPVGAAAAAVGRRVARDAHPARRAHADHGRPRPAAAGARPRRRGLRARPVLRRRLRIRDRGGHAPELRSRELRRRRARPHARAGHLAQRALRRADQRRPRRGRGDGRGDRPARDDRASSAGRVAPGGDARRLRAGAPARRGRHLHGAPRRGRPRVRRAHVRAPGRPTLRRRGGGRVRGARGPRRAATIAGSAPSSSMPAGTAWSA